MTCVPVSSATGARVRDHVGVVAVFEAAEMRHQPDDDDDDDAICSDGSMSASDENTDRFLLLRALLDGTRSGRNQVMRECTCRRSIRRLGSRRSQAQEIVSELVVCGSELRIHALRECVRVRAADVGLVLGLWNSDLDHRRRHHRLLPQHAQLPLSSSLRKSLHSRRASHRLRSPELACPCTSLSRPSPP